jgi:ABC-type dipeptide/oligopeptide/nickel transport system permease subunit
MIETRRRPGVLAKLLRRPVAIVSLGVILTFFIAALLPNQFLPHDPTRQSLRSRFQPPVWMEGGSWRHVLGTDNLGRDLLSRAIRGARVSLLTTTLSVALGAMVGVLLGLSAGYFGGWIDEVLSRLMDVQLAFPLMLLMIAIVGVLGASLTVLVAALALASWPRYARLIRGSALALRDREFVEASRALGATQLGTLFRHVAPNALSPVIVFTTFELSRILLIESALSFLGLGVPPPTPSWGSIIADGRAYLLDAWWISAIPGLLITLLVLAFNFLGDALRDALDPRVTA